MKRKDLQTGMILEQRDGHKTIVILNHCSNITYITQDSVIYENNVSWTGLDNWNDDLFDKNGDVDYDIIKVYQPENPNESLKFKGKLIWERIEPVEMTVAEIEQKLGIRDLKIVK